MAHIDVLTARPIGTVDRRIFGSVAEHLGRCVQGGLIAEEPPAGFRADVLAAVRDLGVTNVRWPLGAAPGGEEPGRFGTGDFLAGSRDAAGLTCASDARSATASAGRLVISTVTLRSVSQRLISASSSTVQTIALIPAR